MPRYHAAITSRAALVNTVLFDIRTNAVKRVRVLEIGIFNAAATTTTLQIERSTTIGTASTTVAPQPGDPADVASTALIGTAFSAEPASTSVPMRRIVLPANIAAGIIWTFGANDDLIIPVSSSLIVMARVASGVTACYVTLDE